MFNILLLVILFLNIHIMYTMDPAPRKKNNRPSQVPSLHLSRERRIRVLSSSGSPRKSEISLKAITFNQDNSQDPSIQKPIIYIANEPSLKKDMVLQKTISELLNDSSHALDQSSPRHIFAETPVETLNQPLLSNPEKTSKKKSSLNTGSRNSSFSESPGTSPRKKPSLLSNKLSTSSPRDSKSSHSSPRDPVTYTDVIEALNTKSSKIKKKLEYFLEDPQNDPNQQDTNTGNTLLHRVVLLHDEKAIDLLLSDPRTHSWIENNDLRKASDLIIGSDRIKYEKLFNKLVTGKILDLILNAMILTNIEMHNPHCSQIFIQQIIHSFLEKILPGILPKYVTTEFMLTAIRHRQTDRLSQLIEFYKKFLKNPNCQDEYGNTMWHYAAMALDENLIKKLASNPDLDSSIRNKENYIAAQLIPTTNKIKTKDLTPTLIQKIQYLKDLRTFFFTREVLELSSSKQAEAIKILTRPSDAHASLIKINLEDLVEAKKLMLKDFEIIAKGQGDSALPETTQFPLYATDDFIFSILKRKMRKTNTQQKTFSVEPISPAILENLLDVLAQESELILSGLVIKSNSKPINDQNPFVSESSED